MRELSGDFITEFMKNKPDIAVLRQDYTRIMLFMRSRNEATNNYVRVYRSYDEAIAYCEGNRESEKDEITERLIESTQILLQSVWNRLKSESGIDKRLDTVSDRYTNRHIAKSRPRI